MKFSRNLTSAWARAALVSVLAALAAAAQEDPVPENFGELARLHIQLLSEDIGQRLAGTPNEVKAAGYIQDVFRRNGYTAFLQPFEFEGDSQDVRTMQQSVNVVAIKRGASSREIVVGAHHDSQGRGGGAGDNASGVGVLLEIAQAIRSVETPYTIRFVTFGAEEAGRLGSRHYVSLMSPRAIENTVAMINLDSLIAGDFAYVYGSPGEAGRLRDWILRRAESEGVDLRTQPGANPEFAPGTTGDFSDHGPFERVGIQYAYFESTNWTLGDGDGYVQVDPEYGDRGHIWHTRFDTLDYIDRTFPGRADERLNLFAELLYTVLTEYTEPE